MMKLILLGLCALLTACAVPVGDCHNGQQTKSMENYEGVPYYFDEPCSE